MTFDLSATWFFINETHHSISYLPDIAIHRRFNVAPFDTTVYRCRNFASSGDVQVRHLWPPIRALAVVIDGVRVDSLLARRLWDIRSYEYLHLGPNRFRLFFRFTYENLAPAQE